jgi:hypothetical protein
MENKAIFNAILEDVVQLDTKDGEAFAALSSNPSVNYIKFTLTDDKPNGNKMRVPQEEFPNIINSGLFMPIKKAVGKIKQGHEDASPLGVISQLKQVEDKIKGIATLWSKERPDDVKQIKEQLKSGKAIHLSWELTYDVNASEKKDGVLTLKDVFLTAATIVGLPSYKGRTTVEAFASQERKEGMAEEIDYEKEYGKLQKQFETLKTNYETLKEEHGTVKTYLVDKDKELVSLKGFKEEVERVNAEREKLGSIKTKFTTAKIVKDEKYFEENKEKLLSLDDNTLEFLLQDLKVFTPTEPAVDDKSKDDKSRIPPVTPPAKLFTEFTPTKLGQALKESLKPQVPTGK